MEELVFASRKGNAVTDSLLVAKKFEKQHKHVLDAIRNIIQSAENSAELYVSTTYKDSTGRSNEKFIMKRDGFTLLVMGFTGSTAIQFKLDFINAFNEMERRLMAVQPLYKLPDFNNPVEAARAWADATEQRMLAEKSVKELQPKAEVYDRIMSTDGCTDINSLAKSLGTGRTRLFALLRANYVVMKSKPLPYQEYVDSGYFTVKSVEKNKLLIEQMFVTTKGIDWITKNYDKWKESTEKERSGSK